MALLPLAGAEVCVSSDRLPTIRALRAQLSPYMSTDDRQAYFSLTTSFVVFIASIAAMPWARPVAVLVMAAMITRLFSIFHACGHGAFFSTRAQNERWGTVLAFTLTTPYAYWKTSHNQHHRGSSNLDTDDPGDSALFTRRQWEEMSPARRLLWRIVRGPAVFFTIVPVTRWYLYYPFEARDPVSIAGLASIVLASVFYDYGIFVAHCLSTMIAFVMFHLHHVVDPGHRVRGAEYDFVRAGVEGCTWFEPPRILAWVLFSLELHHIHHLAPRMPPYRMHACHASLRDAPWVRQGRIGLRQAIVSLSLVMWDETRERFVSFGPREGHLRLFVAWLRSLGRSRTTADNAPLLSTVRALAPVEGQALDDPSRVLEELVYPAVDALAHPPTLIKSPETPLSGPAAQIDASLRGELIALLEIHVSNAVGEDVSLGCEPVCPEDVPLTLAALAQRVAAVARDVRQT